MTAALKEKQALRAELVAQLTSTLTALERAHADAATAATHEEAKPENDKDTRALEASYLARGQALRLEALKLGVVAVERLALEDLAGRAVALGALVDAEEGETTARFFLAPEGGGTRLAGGVQVVTPASPLGRALLGKRVGDEVEVMGGGKRRELVVVDVQ